MSAAAFSESVVSGATALPPCVPISYGSIAFNVGKGRLASHPDHTHKWTVFLRGAYNQDITYAISKVVFSLHPSFADHIRGADFSSDGLACLACCSNASSFPPSPTQLPELSSPPFQVSETGWGAFEVGIEVYLKDVGSPPFVLNHLLKLHPDPVGHVAASAVGAPEKAASGDKPVLSEHYDEIVFHELPADPANRAALLAGPIIEPPPLPYQDALTVFTPEADLAAISNARSWIAERSKELEERLVKARVSEDALSQALVDLGVA
jgi:YEATS domain-containing protein 4